MHTLNVRGLTTFALTLLTATLLAGGVATVAVAAPAAAPPGATSVAAADAEFPALARGSRGDAVRIAQRLLAYHGYPTAPDGIFGPHTQQRIRQFQTDRGLPVTGRIDTRTWEWLVIEVGRGDRGEPVRITQWLLGVFGQPIAVDGIFGPRTEAATRSFREAFEMAASGMADLDTWRVMLANL